MKKLDVSDYKNKGIVTLNNKKYVFNKVLGKGSFGEVVQLIEFTTQPNGSTKKPTSQSL